MDFFIHRDFFRVFIVFFPFLLKLQYIVLLETFSAALVSVCQSTLSVTVAMTVVTRLMKLAALPPPPLPPPPGPGPHQVLL